MRVALGGPIAWLFITSENLDGNQQPSTVRACLVATAAKPRFHIIRNDNNTTAPTMHAATTAIAAGNVASTAAIGK